MKKIARVVQDIIHSIDNDEWMWTVCWGSPRSGKSSLCMWIAYLIYKDWDKVLNCIVFNLSQCIYKIKYGLPELWPTRNLLHDRVPILIWDDFGAYSNKAITQHDPAWDTFKGAFDTLGTKVAVIIANMVSPGAPTQQLQIKFTHELWIPTRGHCKYDTVETQQDYGGWGARSKKKWLQDFGFPEVPSDVFKQYDEMRMSLADEVLQKVDDQIVDVHLGSIIKKMQPLDLRLLQLIQERGLVYAHKIEKELGPTARAVSIRLKSRQLITPVRLSANYYKYDITPLGIEVLKAIDEKEKEAPKIPNP